MARKKLPFRGGRVLSKAGFYFSTNEIRDALRRINETSQESLAPPDRRTLYLPSGHIKALNLASSVVVGLRGTGKSYWTAVLASTSHRNYLAQTARLPELQKTTVSVGFALDPSGTDFPSATVLATLSANGIDPQDVWQTIVLWHALSALGLSFPCQGEWEDRIQWFSSNRKEGLTLLGKCDRDISARGEYLLVLFDALDRLADEWTLIRSYLRSLLNFCLECRSRRAIRLKIFLRPDMEEDDEIWKFVDSSKLRANRVELTWRPTDLYGLVLLYLANDDYAGCEFRQVISRVAKIEWQDADGVYLLPRGLGASEQPTREIVEAITGPWVGTSAKRGYVYTWVPTHLADAKGRLSPRSFLLAFRESAEWTENHEPEHEHALHFRGIQQGVAKASEIRVGEISEDYPWVKPLLEAARGLTVPCELNDLTVLWKRGALSQLRKASAGKLPPRRFNTDSVRHGTPEALIDDLVELAVLYRTEDSRLNVPDIFRVGFGVKRKGGVRPPR